MVFRTPIIAGNWKMNNTAKEGVALVNALKPLVADAKCEVVVCVPAIDIPAVAEAGAFTGEISASMLLEYGVEYVIIGHSERRQYFGETDETVNKRTIAALHAGLKPIVCVGETLAEREGGKTEEVLSRQVREGLANIADLTNVVIAYEPVWAIGTGRTASCDQANETIRFIRRTCASIFGKEQADLVRIQYGGSMNADNYKLLMSMPDIDGGLIGGASLKAIDFSAIVKYDKGGMGGMKLRKELL